MIFSRKANPTVYDRLVDLRRQRKVEPIDVHHYVAAHEVVQLIRENFGVAFIAKGMAAQIETPEIVIRPLNHEILHLKTYLVLRADESSRLVNEFGRAFLKRLRMSPHGAGHSEQMQLNL